MKTTLSWTRMKFVALMLLALALVPAFGAFSAAEAKPWHDRSNSRHDRRWDNRDRNRGRDNRRWDNRRWNNRRPDNRRWGKAPQRRFVVKYHTVRRNGRTYRQYYRVYL